LGKAVLSLPPGSRPFSGGDNLSGRLIAASTTGGKGNFSTRIGWPLDSLIPLDELWEKTWLMERVILLRALIGAIWPGTNTGKDRRLTHEPPFENLSISMRPDVSYYRCSLQGFSESATS
jgi:hypothetical protein